MQRFEVVVIGGGHAGIEAANAAAKMGANTAMFTMDKHAVGRMSCNPAIGGLAKGQLVREIDALGGIMGRAGDRAGIQFRMLNRSKGPAVWGPRAQMDMDLYSQITQQMLEQIPDLTVLSGELDSFIQKNPGFELDFGPEGKVFTQSLIITSGTFLGAVMYTGLNPVSGGRIGERAADKLADCIKSLGLRTRRLKTGTPSRLDRQSIDFSKTTVQDGDPEPIPFSFDTDFGLKNHAVCWISHTNEKTHEILRTGFSQSPMFTGSIKGIGPRYCPSIEDKIDRFADKTSHQLFLEPEGTGNNRIYVNGFSSSLPAEIQYQALQTIPGLENCKVLRYGYAVEYDAIDATQLDPSFMCKDIPGLYFAGQVNGTSGYEEAAGQGLIAGINSALRLKDEGESFYLERAEGYLGVMADDLTTFDLDEPYRMFSSRAEYRLFLRQDNAEERLIKYGRKFGLIDDTTWRKWENFQYNVNTTRSKLSESKASAKKWNEILSKSGSSPLKETIPVLELLRRPELSLDLLMKVMGLEEHLTTREKLFLEASEKYSGFLKRQQRDINRGKNLAGMKIPFQFDYAKAEVLSTEARQKLSKIRPATVGQASRISGVTPADVSGLIFYLTKAREKVVSQA